MSDYPGHNFRQQQWRSVEPVSVDQGWMIVEGDPVTNELVGHVIKLHNSELPPHHPSQFDPVMWGKVYAWTVNPDTVYFWRGIRMQVKGDSDGHTPATRGGLPPFDN